MFKDVCSLNSEPKSEMFVIQCRSMRTALLVFNILLKQAGFRKKHFNTLQKCTNVRICNRFHLFVLILFSIFLNDLENYLLTNNNACLDKREEELNILLKNVFILYTDDTVLFAYNGLDYQVLS